MADKNANARRSSIQNMLNKQSQELLRKGSPGGNWDKFDQIRQRHIWSKFHVTSGYAGSLIDAAGLFTPTGPLNFFASATGQNGAGLPAGFNVDDLDTNFPGVNRVADDHNWVVEEIGVTIESPRQDVIGSSGGAMIDGPPALWDVDQLLEGGIIKIKYLTNEVIYGPLAQYAQPGGVSIAGPSLEDYSAAEAVTVAQLTGGANETTARQARWNMNSGPIPAMPKLRRKLDVPFFLPARQTFNFRVFFPRPIQLLPLAAGGTGGFTVRIDWWAIESFRERG